MSMTDAEFDVFLDNAHKELAKKQEGLIADYDLGSHRRWMYETENSYIQFFDSYDRLVLEADIIDIGSFSPGNNTWKWAWAYESITEANKTESLRLKELEEITDLVVFGAAEPVEADEYMAWDLAAMAVKFLGAHGCYRAHSSKRNVNMFFAIMNLRKIEPSSAE